MATRHHPPFFDKREADALTRGFDKAEAFRAIPMDYWNTAPLSEALSAWDDGREEIMENADAAAFYVYRTEGKAAADSYERAYHAHLDKIGNLLNRRYFDSVGG